MTLSCGRSSCQAQYRGEASLRTWLHQILSHLAVDRARHHAHELSVEDVEILWRDQAYTSTPRQWSRAPSRARSCVTRSSIYPSITAA